MFRIISGNLKVRRLLHRVHVPELIISSLQRYGNKCNRSHAKLELCPQPKEEARSPKNDSIFWGAMAVLTLAGGFAVYAKHNPEMRDWLTIHAPWMDDIVAVAYQENMSYLEFALFCLEEAKDCTLKNINNFLSPDECNPVQNIEHEQIIIDEGDSDKPCKLLPPPIITTDICRVEACLKDLTETTINNYMTARDACRYYNKLVAESLQKFTFPGLKSLRAAMVERRDLVETSVANAKTEHERFGTLSQYLNCSENVDKEKLENTRKLLRELDDRIKTVNIEYQHENDKSGALDDQWMKLEAFLERYMNEISAMYPELNYMDQKPGIVSDPEFFLYHTRKYVQTLKDNLHKTLDAMTLKIDSELETLPQGELEVQNRTKEISRLYSQKHKDLENESAPAAKTKEIKQDVDELTKALLNQMKRKHEADIIRKTMEEEQKMMKNFDKMVAERVKAETDEFGRHLRRMSTNLNVVNLRLQKCSMAMNESKRSQDLYAAGSSLLKATKKGDPSVNVTIELKALEKASGSDELVAAVLKAIPRSVWVDGVVPESVLRHKYQSMESIAMKVALVEGKKPSLVVYFFSLIQSFFLSMKISAIPNSELDNPPEDLECKYDAVDLLQRARYFMDRGNIPAAFRYVDALRGASRGAAASWLEAAQAHVKIRQAAEIIIAHAVAMGLKYV